MDADTVTTGPTDIPDDGESRAVLPPINGTGGIGSRGMGRAERKVYLMIDLERATQALGELE